MPTSQDYKISILQGLRAHFNQPSGPSLPGTDWTISIANSTSDHRIIVRTYSDDVTPISQERQARLALEFIIRLLDSGWSPDQYRGTPGELVVPPQDVRDSGSAG